MYMYIHTVLGLTAKIHPDVCSVRAKINYDSHVFEFSCVQAEVSVSSKIRVLTGLQRLRFSAISNRCVCV